MTTQNFTLERKIGVKMRSNPPSYSPGNARLNDSGQASQTLATFDDSSFAKLVDSMIAVYRFTETSGGFADTPGKCAELKFSPASDTLKLKKGQTGTVDVRVLRGYSVVTRSPPPRST